MQSKLLFVLASVATASVLPRETASSECIADAQSLRESFPLPTDPAIVKDVQKATNPCSYTPASSLASQWSSYLDEIKTWAKTEESALSKIEAECPQQTAVADLQCFNSQESSSKDSSSSPKDSKGSEDSKKSAASTVQVAAGAILGAALVAVLAL